METKNHDFLHNSVHQGNEIQESVNLLAESNSEMTTPPSEGSLSIPPSSNMGEDDFTKPSSPDSESLAPIQREKWTRKMDFILSVAGGFVGLGNVWRFPYLCYKNGGGAFLIPYAIFLVLGGIPIFFLEVSLGQYMSEGGVTSWRITPIGTGIGYASMVVVALLNIYYIVILAWAFFYLFQSFTAELPWGKCGQYWNTPCCVATYSKSNSLNQTLLNISMSTVSPSLTTVPGTYNATLCNGTRTSPETEYWESVHA